MSDIPGDNFVFFGGYFADIVMFAISVRCVRKHCVREICR